MPGVSVLSFAEKKVPKKAPKTYYCVSFRGAAIGQLCYCGAELIGSDGFVMRISFFVLMLWLFFLWQQRKEPKKAAGIKSFIYFG